MIAAIMQPYFLPYLGYFQLISAVNVFVVYDNIEYTKKGWVNRNRLLKNGKDALFTIPVKHDSDYLEIQQREISADVRLDKILNQIREAYRKAPHISQKHFHSYRLSSPSPERNLFRYIHHSIVEVCRYVGITTPIVTSSSIQADHSLRSEERVIAICQAIGASGYINPVGGVVLYSAEKFRAAGIELSFLKSNGRDYRQFGTTFIPSLSVMDILMFNSREQTQAMLKDYILLNASETAMSGSVLQA